jgi:copper homeostasis protein
LLLEVCAFNIQSCFIAEQAGALRIELCADPLQGGTTPSYGLIRYAMEHISIPIYPMIRPRGGNFVYDELEVELMRQDIMICKELGCPGIATGIQLPGGGIDTDRLRRMVEWAYPMEVTCHKVFDVTPDAFRSLENVIDAGCKRVLTSGLQKTAPDGAKLLAQLVARAAGRIIVMPGGGVRSSNIGQLIKDTGATEYHSSALVAKTASHIVDANEVHEMAAALK